jgi:hypothetical protein
VFRRHAKDEILLLASDGLWDVMPNQEATDLAMRCIRRARDKGASPKAAARVAATILTKAAVDRGSRDNITVMVIDLSRAGAAARAGGAGAAEKGDVAEAAAAKQRPAGGRLAAAAAAAEAAAAAGGTGKRPVPQRIITEQPSVVGTAPPGVVAREQQQPGSHLAGEASLVAPGQGPRGAPGPFGQPAVTPFVAASPLKAPDAADGAGVTGRFAALAVSAMAAPSGAPDAAQQGELKGPFATIALVAAAAEPPAAAQDQQQQQQEEAEGSAGPQHGEGRSSPISAQRQASASPFSATSLPPFDEAARRSSTS